MYTILRAAFMVVAGVGAAAPIAEAQDTILRPDGGIIVVRITELPPPTDSTLFGTVDPDHPLLRELTEKSPSLSGDTIYLYSEYPDRPWSFAGTALDTAFYGLFELFYTLLRGTRTGSAMLFAAGALALDSSHVAYLLRVPGMYSPMALDLWIYDAQDQRFSTPLRVADAWGDAGEWRDVWSWLVDLNNDGARDLITRRVQGAVDIGVDSMPLLYRRDSLYIAYWKRDGFTVRQASEDSVLNAIFEPQEWPRP
jgi:hypothetical protein